MKLPKLAAVLLLGLLLPGTFVFAQEFTPNDPLYGQQWYLSKLNMSQIWNQEKGKSSVIIAVIDTGVDISHPDLHDNIWVNQKEILGDGLDNDNNGYVDDINGWDFLVDNNDPNPKYQADCLFYGFCSSEAITHGTLVAGVAAAVGDNNLGIAGMAWQVKIMPLRALNENGAGNTTDVIKAINYAISNGADVINLSFVGDVYDAALEQAVQKAYDAGLVIVAAAGNEDDQGGSVNLDLHKRYPACFKGSQGENIIIGVGASDTNDQLALFSDYGSSCIDVLAPGQDFIGTIVYDPEIQGLDQYYLGGFSGTSLAAPVVSGLAALILSAKPELKNYEVYSLIFNTAQNIDALNPNYSGQLGRGLINPAKIFQNLEISTAANRLIKGTSSAVYYLASNGKRYAFGDEKTYLSWYSDFTGVKQISDAELAGISLGGLVTLKPGNLVKIATDPKVYAISKGGILRWVQDETIARALYGSNWNKMVVDVSDAFFTNYSLGSAISSSSDYSPQAEKNSVLSIDDNLRL